MWGSQYGRNKRDQTWFGLAMILCGALVSILALILGGSLVAGDVTAGGNFDWLGWVQFHRVDDGVAGDAEC